MLTKVFSATLAGIEAKIVEVEVDISNGLPAFNIVGLVDAAIRESKERVRGCIRNSILKYPIARISVNLAPADLYKYGTQFDLAIAIGMLLSSGQLRADVSDAVFVGELSMHGNIKPIHGAVAMVIAAKED
ncbi:MAG TPA: magnesium chelatase domain-containing protein, partial [Patescibacteria group bacterium]